MLFRAPISKTGVSARFHHTRIKILFCFWNQNFLSLRGNYNIRFEDFEAYCCCDCHQYDVMLAEYFVPSKLTDHNIHIFALSHLLKLIVYEDVMNDSAETYHLKYQLEKLYLAPFLASKHRAQLLSL